MYANGTNPVTYVSCTPESGTTIDSFDSFILHFDLSDFFSAGYEDDGKWGIGFSGRILLFDGDYDGYKGVTGDPNILATFNTKTDGTTESFKVGSDFEFSFPDADIKPNSKYKIIVHANFFATPQGTTDATARKVSLLNSQGPYITLEFTTGSSSEVKTCYLVSSEPVSGNSLGTISTISLTFNEEVQVNAGATATLTDNDTDNSAGGVSSTDIAVDENDPKTVNVTFAEQTLYDGIKYTVTLPKGSISLASDAGVSNNSDITLTYNGTEHRYFGVLDKDPEDGSIIVPKTIKIGPDFPVGCGFVYLATQPTYEIKLYEGATASGESVAAFTGTLDNNAFAVDFNVAKFDYKDGTQYTFVLEEGMFKPYIMGTEKYRTDYIFERTELHYTTPVNVGVDGCGITEGSAMASLGMVAFYTVGGVTAADGAVAKLMKDGDVVKEAAVEILVRDGGAVAVADFSGEGHAPLALEEGASYTLVLPQGSLVGSDGAGVNTGMSVNFTGAVSAPAAEYASVTLSVEGYAASVTKAVKGEPYTLTVTPEEDWSVASLLLDGTTDVTEDITDGTYTIEELTADTELALTLEYTGAAYEESTATGIVEVSDSGLKAWSENGRIVVEGLAAGDAVAVYGTGGARLLQFTAADSRADITVPTGMVYIVKVNGTVMKLTNK